VRRLYCPAAAGRGCLISVVHDGGMQTVRERAALLTVGYEGRSAAEVVQLLDDADVAVLVDVRLTPLSRKPGLSKRRLASLLKEAGLAYRHLPALGNPKENRDGFRRGEARSRDTFRAVLSSPAAEAALRELRELVREHRVALLCFERDVECCHRQLVTETLVEGIAGMLVEHL
jgi:uncharacterized protein (DUF488 family)